MSGPEAEPARTPPDALPPGVRALDHTADVALEIEAPDLPALFVRAGQGLEALIAGSHTARTPGAGSGTEAALVLEAADVALLLAEWLRELLFLRQVRHRAFAGAAFDELAERRLAARVRTVAAPGAVREIKGVTYHGLLAEPGAGGWRARVIFDV